jgi:RND family efflux transporter MFP subunit
MKTKIYLSLITIALLSASCGKKEEKKAIQQEEIMAVQVQPVVSKALSVPITGSGVLASKSEMKLAFKTGGMIRRVYVNEGESVRKGELLAELDLSEIDAQVRQAKVGLAKASRDLERVKRLYADEATTLQNVQDATSGFEAATESVEIAQFNQKLSKIYAPTSGRILRKIAEQGELITPFSPAFILATGESAYIVNIGLSDKDLVKIKIGNKANVKIDAYPEAIFTATITQIAQAVNPATGTYEIELELAKTAGYKLVSGFVVKAELIPNNVPTSLTIPIESLVEANGNQAFVFTLNIDNQSVTRKEISVGNIIENQVEVKSGLSENEQVVVRGGGFLSDKSRVKVAK